MIIWNGLILRSLSFLPPSGRFSSTYIRLIALYSICYIVSISNRGDAGSSIISSTLIILVIRFQGLESSSACHSVCCILWKTTPIMST